MTPPGIIGFLRPDGTFEPISDRLLLEMRRAIVNSDGHCKRSLLDLVDYKVAVMKPAERHQLRVLIEFLKRRIHADVSVMGQQFLAAFEIFLVNGQIPPFGREKSEDEVQGDVSRMTAAGGR